MARSYSWDYWDFWDFWNISIHFFSHWLSLSIIHCWWPFFRSPLTSYKKWPLSPHPPNSRSTPPSCNKSLSSKDSPTIPSGKLGFNPRFKCTLCLSLSTGLFFILLWLVQLTSRNGRCSIDEYSASLPVPSATLWPPTSIMIGRIRSHAPQCQKHFGRSSNPFSGPQDLLGSSICSTRLYAQGFILDPLTRTSALLCSSLSRWHKLVWIYLSHSAQWLS